MNKSFNITEAFVIAVQLEKNGAAFYKSAASSVSDSAAREFLEELAAQEQEHEKIFAEIAESSMGRIEMDETVKAYLTALSIEFVFNLEHANKDWKNMTFLNTIDFAIEREKDAIIFFSGMTAALEGEECKKINRIIQEEKSHLIDLLGLKRRFC